MIHSWKFTPVFFAILFFYIFDPDDPKELLNKLRWLCLLFMSILLIIQRCSMLKQTIWHSNHTSHKKKWFYEFVANVLRDNIGILIFDLRAHGGCWRPKTSLGGQKWHEGVDLLKKVFNKSFSTTSKTPWRVQSDLSYDLR